MLQKVLEQFNIKGEPNLFGNGHINTTYLIDESHIVQKINTEVFKNPHGVMDNIFLVTEHIKNNLVKNGESPERQTIDYLYTKEGKKLCETDDGFYRAYKFIDNAYSVESEKSTPILYNAAKAIGKFQKLLSDFDANNLFTAIPNFHNTPVRVDNFKNSLNKNVSGRAEKAEKLIMFAENFSKNAGLITGAINDGSVPLRVSHNDTKLNNVLFDNKTDEGICVIDLDTVMSGSYLYDFGDAMRFGASSCDEDCTEKDKIFFDLSLFEAFTKGYLESAAEILTEREKQLLFTSVMIMTYECGTRFLTDFIDGDTYFKTAYPEHNFDRAFNQYSLVEDMLKKQEQAEKIVKKYL